VEHADFVATLILGDNEIIETLFPVSFSAWETTPWSAVQRAAWAALHTLR
jgi:hypothetical protein